MRTFDAQPRNSSFWLAVVLPPVGYWLLVQWFAATADATPISGLALAGLIALANGLPLAALGWMLCSVAAYSVGPGELIVHRVVSDRRISLAEMRGRPAIMNGAVRVRLGRFELVLRVPQPEEFAASLEQARDGACVQPGRR